MNWLESKTNHHESSLVIGANADLKTLIFLLLSIISSSSELTKLSISI